MGCKSATQTPSGEGQERAMAAVRTAVDLDPAVRETSGILLHGEDLWTHNDSGNEPYLYRLDPKSGALLGSVQLPFGNVDWEDLAMDSTHVFLADMGNNLGSRKDLVIYKLPISLLSDSLHLAAADIDRIEFHFPEQQHFPNSYNHNFDAEALITYGDHLLVFTKNWADKKSSVYQLPKAPGQYAAQKLFSLETGGLITAADCLRDKIYLLGYNYDGVNTPFVWMFEGYDALRENRGLRYDLHLNRQTEALALDVDGTIMISAEQAKSQAPSLFVIDL